jgi:hypothetical protein
VAKYDGPAAGGAAGEAGGDRDIAGQRSDTVSARPAQLASPTTGFGAQCFGHLADLRFRHAVERLHRLGPRPLYEMLVALGASRLIRTEIERQVERYAALDTHIVCAVGGDRFACAPIHLALDRKG